MHSKCGRLDHWCRPSWNPAGLSLDFEFNNSIFFMNERAPFTSEVCPFFFVPVHPLFRSCPLAHPHHKKTKQSKTVARFLSGRVTGFHCDSAMAETAKSSCFVDCVCICVRVCLATLACAFQHVCVTACSASEHAVVPICYCDLSHVKANRVMLAFLNKHFHYKFVGGGISSSWGLSSEEAEGSQFKPQCRESR